MRRGACFPAFFPLLKPAGAFEILAHRIVWCFVLMVVVIAAVRRLGDIRAITARTWLLLAFASALISVNWVIYIYAVNNGHVVDAALGYFINPLVTVALGLLIFRERLNRRAVRRAGHRGGRRRGADRRGRAHRRSSVSGWRCRSACTAR